MGIQVRENYMGSGNTPLPFHRRTFTSFNFDGKDIEEFDFLVTFANAGLTKTDRPSFSATTAQYGIIDGQTFFYTNYQSETIVFQLSTDGITEKQLTDFTRFFQADKKADFILSEHPNRVAKARISSAPALSLMPFEKEFKTKIYGVEKDVLTTEYKGAIDIQFILDDPFWEAKKCYFTEEEMQDEINIKIAYEDGVPFEGAFDEDFLASSSIILPDRVLGLSKESITINDESSVYIYNCGTAKVFPIIKFTHDVELDEDKYVISPKTVVKNPERKFSYIKIGDNYQYFTGSGYFAAYNAALKTVYSHGFNDANEDVLNDLRENVNDYYMRANAIKVFNEVAGKEIVYSESIQNAFVENLSEYIPTEFNCSINSHSGEVIINFVDGEGKEITQNAGDMLTSSYITFEPKDTTTEEHIKPEDCMLVSASEELRNFEIIFNYSYLG